MTFTRTFLTRLTPFLRPVHSRLFSSRPPPSPLSSTTLRRFPSVRLISEAGVDCGLMTGSQALSKANSANLDVIRVSSSNPPVLRLLNIAVVEEARRKKAYALRKTQKENNKLQRRESILKQVRLSPATDQNDIDIKIRQARNFLTAGYRVRLYMQFRRGHGALSDLAKETLIRLATDLSDVGNVQGIPPGGSVADIFKPPPQSEDDQPQPKSKAPLQLNFFPLSRKVRQNKEQSQST